MVAPKIWRYLVEPKTRRTRGDKFAGHQIPRSFPGAMVNSRESTLICASCYTLLHFPTQRSPLLTGPYPSFCVAKGLGESIGVLATRLINIYKIEHTSCYLPNCSSKLSTSIPLWHPPPSHLLSSCSLINDDDHRTTTSDSGYPDKKFPFEIIRSVHDARSHSAQCHKTLRYSANFFSQFRRGHEFSSFLNLLDKPSHFSLRLSRRKCDVLIASLSREPEKCGLIYYSNHSF